MGNKSCESYNYPGLVPREGSRLQHRMGEQHRLGEHHHRLPISLSTEDTGGYLRKPETRFIGRVAGKEEVHPETRKDLLKPTSEY
jgi:hypothetical protein